MTIPTVWERESPLCIACGNPSSWHYEEYYAGSGEWMCEDCAPSAEEENNEVEKARATETGSVQVETLLAVAVSLTLAYISIALAVAV